MALVIIVHVIICGGCVFIFIGFDVNITVFYTSTNVPLISFNIVGKVLIVSSVLCHHRCYLHLNIGVWHHVNMSLVGIVGTFLMIGVH